MADRKLLYRAGGNTNEMSPSADAALMAAVDSQGNPFVMRAGGSDRVTLLTTGELIIGGNTLAGAERLSIQRHHDGNTDARVYNTSDTASAHVTLSVQAVSGAMQMGATAPNFTVSPLVANNTAFLGAAGMTSGLVVYTDNATPLKFATANTERIRILSTGEVGIGISTPVVLLHVQHPTAGTNVRIQEGAAAAGAYLSFIASAGAGYGFIGDEGSLMGSGANFALRADTGRALVIATNGANERVRILSGGQVLINKTTQTNGGQLEVSGKVYGSGEFEIDGDLNHDGTNVGLFGANPVGQAAAKANLTDSTGGAVDGTLVDVGAIFDQANINNNFADLADRVNHLMNIVRNLGAMAT